MLQVVEHSEKQDDIELAEIAPGEPADIADAVFNARAEQPSRLEQTRIPSGIERKHLRAAAFHFKAEPAIPRAHVEHALAAQIHRDRELLQTAAQLFDGLMTFDNG